jgi:hypothetical protein
MKKNMGSTDSLIRIVLAVVLLLLLFTKVITGSFAIIAGVAVAILLLTAFVRFCPLYLPFGVRTNKDK